MTHSFLQIPEKITDPLTGELHCLLHLKPFSTSYKATIDDKDQEISVYVKFSTHCYTKRAPDNTPDDQIVLIETRSKGIQERRVFAKERWEFSLKLPELIQSLQDKNCYEGSREHIFYRLEDPNHNNPGEGWYTCAKFAHNKKRTQVHIVVNSIHHRPSTPGTIKSTKRQRFKSLLRNFYKKTIKA